MAADGSRRSLGRIAAAMCAVVAAACMDSPSSPSAMFVEPVEIIVPGLTIARIVVTPPSQVMEAGTSIKLDADAFAAGGLKVTVRSFEWALTDSSVATIASDGTLNALRAGRTAVHAIVGG